MPEAATAAPAPAEDAQPPKPEPGWYRNTAATPLIVQPHQYPSKQLAPGEATWLPDNPRHRDIEPCGEPPQPAPSAEPADGTDTTGSEQ